MDTKQRQLNVRITPELYKALADLAHDARKSLTAFVRDNLKDLTQK